MTSRTAVTLRGVVVLNDGVHRVLDGAEAALWDLLGRGYSAHAATRLIAAIAHLEHDGAQRFVRRCLAEWREAGLHG
jgi:hypothetical protein